jgi:hypothetical protein
MCGIWQLKKKDVPVTAHFDQARWARIKDDAQRWWAGELGRPLIQVRLKPPHSDRDAPALPIHEFASFYPMDVPVEQIVDGWDHDLGRTLFLGDAFPHVCPNFGPGVIAAFMGANLVNGEDTVWFHSDHDTAISDLEFVFDEANPWFCRCRDLVMAAVGRWQGSVQCAMTDLGGNLDILSVFRSAETLLFDLYDNPEQVKRLTWQAHELWWRYFDEFCALAQGTNPGYSTWAALLSEESHYMLQCDFCYMIGPDMFDEFVKPELKASADRLVNAVYHMDGQGQLAHLDSLLDIESIKGIQWVPGAGAPDVCHWPEIYGKITDAGKKIHIASNMCDRPLEVLDVLLEQLGRIDHIVYHFEGDVSQQADVESMLRRHHVI